MLISIELENTRLVCCSRNPSSSRSIFFSSVQIILKHFFFKYDNAYSYHVFLLFHPRNWNDFKSKASSFFQRTVRKFFLHLFIGKINLWETKQMSLSVELFFLVVFPLSFGIFFFLGQKQLMLP